VVNALEIKATLSEEKVSAPALLFKKYPQLEDSAVAEESTEAKGERMLFT